MNDIIEIAKRIQSKIDAIESERLRLQAGAIEKATALSEYEKSIAITIIELRNGVEKELDGRKIINPPATIIEKIARGICYKECLRMEKADALYKAIVTNIQALEAVLNGYQSINRHLSDK